MHTVCVGKSIILSMYVTYYIAGIFGGELDLAVYFCNYQIKIRQYSILV